MKTLPAIFAGAIRWMFPFILAITSHTLVADPLPLTTFINPTPANGDDFGWSVSAVGTDQVLIGAPHVDTSAFDAGEAYLFSTNGTLLTTITNPTPASGEEFGYCVAGVGTDRVLIGVPRDDTGAIDAGVAYLFSTNGMLMNTFTNPTPEFQGYFGQSLATVGTDRVLIGANGDNTGGTHAGAVYLFSTNGTLLTTITNPAPAYRDYFGWSVAAVGTDRVLIGTPVDDAGVGAAYLFNTSGTLMTTFTNPTPVVNDAFGCSVAGVGTHQVLIGAYRDDTGGDDAGAVYLFSTDGTLLTTFIKSAPLTGEYFGWSVAAAGIDRVLIGSLLDEISGDSSGAAYLFRTDGTVLTNYYADSRLFGQSVAPLGTDRILVGACDANIGAAQTGAAYLFGTPMQTPGAPTLSIVPFGAGYVEISWTPPSTNWVLLESLNLLLPAWTNAPSGTNNPAVAPATLPLKYYRLYQP